MTRIFELDPDGSMLSYDFFGLTRQGNVNLNKTPTPSSNPGLNLNKPKQDNLPAYMKGL